MDNISKVGLDSSYSFKKSDYNIEKSDIKTLSNGLMYYGHIRYDNHYVVATRTCMKTNGIRNPFLNTSFDIELYDKEFQPLALLKLKDKNILKFEVDLDAGYLWAWDMTGGFDYIYRYDVNDILRIL
ncbi:MAG: hypothetical protein SNG38_04245 [Rikenellaceae bacterium]